MYQTDELYDFCDSRGLLVWQEFMFACTPYPIDKGMIDEVRSSCLHSIPGPCRIRQHHHARPT